MKIPRNLAFSTLLAALTIPAIAGSPVSYPGSGSQVVSPFDLSASAATCLDQPVATIGYSLDDGSDTIVPGSSIQVSVASPFGLHTLHVKIWGNGGAECDTDVGIAVTPSNAIDVSNIQRMGSWGWLDRNDPVVHGTTTANTTFSNFGYTRQFDTTFTNWGAELYYAPFGTDTTAKNFLYDAWVNIQPPSDSIDNLEMDMNQVMANGQTVIFGFQCDGNSSTWDYTTNSGTPQNPVDQWVNSTQACNVAQWSTNFWHHVQISYSRDDSGNVTYNAVALDGDVQTIAVTVPSSFALGWSPALLTNFEVDGRGASGSSNIYLNDLSIYRW